MKVRTRSPKKTMQAISFALALPLLGACSANLEVAGKIDKSTELIEISNSRIGQFLKILENRGLRPGSRIQQISGTSEVGLLYKSPNYEFDLSEYNLPNGPTSGDPMADGILLAIVAELRDLQSRLIDIGYKPHIYADLSCSSDSTKVRRGTRYNGALGQIVRFDPSFATINNMPYDRTIKVGDLVNNYDFALFRCEALFQFLGKNADKNAPDPDFQKTYKGTAYTLPHQRGRGYRTVSVVLRIVREKR